MMCRGVIMIIDIYRGGINSFTNHFARGKYLCFYIQFLLKGVCIWGKYDNIVTVALSVVRINSIKISFIINNMLIKLASSIVILMCS